MALFKKTVTRPLPAGAEIVTRDGEQVARWKPPKGRTQTAPVTRGRDGSLRVRVKSSMWYGRFRNSKGRVVERSTKCRDRDAAQSVLREWEHRVEKVRAGVLTADEDAAAARAHCLLDDHVRDWLRALEARGAHRNRREAYRRRVGRVLRECGFVRARDLCSSAVEHWLTERRLEGLSASEWNETRTSLVAFASWLVRNGRLPSNPFAGLERLNSEAERCLERRALSNEECARLLEAARERPLADAMIIRTGKRAGESGAKVSDKRRRLLELEGEERRLCYLLALTTGLRRGELRSLTVSSLRTDHAERTVLALKAADEKARRGALIPLRDDVASELGRVLDLRLEHRRSEATRRADPIPTALAPDDRLVAVPTARTFNRTRHRRCRRTISEDGRRRKDGRLPWASTHVRN